ncbi:MAG: hypothetical protein UH239_04110 [Acutalibacteraceae bacterium]|nr:hypothetical protein [Acutalibacteraceae bacterium]
MVGCAVSNNNYAGIYYGISGFQNPTKQDSVADWLQNRYDDEYPKWLENRNEEGSEYCFYRLDNCGEFNAVNTALHNEANPENLSLYSVRIKHNGEYKSPCENCQHLYESLSFISK